MDINHYVAQYGYAALIIGGLAEGGNHYPVRRRCGASGRPEISLDLYVPRFER